MAELELMKEVVPLEDDEQIEVVTFLEDHGLLFCAPSMNMWTSSWAQKARAHRLGARRGIQDLIIVVLPHQSVDGKGRLLFVEMKRQRGSTVSADQKVWNKSINALRISGVDAVIAHGAAEAKTYLQKHVKPVSPF